MSKWTLTGMDFFLRSHKENSTEEVDNLRYESLGERYELQNTLKPRLYEL